MGAVVCVSELQLNQKLGTGVLAMVMHATVKAGTKTGKSCCIEQHQHSRRGDNEVRSTVQWDGRTLTRGGSANRIGF